MCIERPEFGFLTFRLLPGDPGWMWPNTMGTIDRVVQEMKSFVGKVEVLAEDIETKWEIG